MKVLLPKYAQENGITTEYNDFRYTMLLKNYLANKLATLLVVEYVGNIPIRATSKNNPQPLERHVCLEIREPYNEV